MDIYAEEISTLPKKRNNSSIFSKDTRKLKSENIKYLRRFISTRLLGFF